MSLYMSKFTLSLFQRTLFSCAHRNIPWEVASHDGRNAGRTESRFGSSSRWHV